MFDAPPPPRSAALMRVEAGDSCAGCGGCALIAPDAIAMRMRPPGYLRPVQIGPVGPDREALIARVCPGLVHEVAAAGRRDDPLWGPFLEMREGHAADPGLRWHGSSGGVLSAVLAHLLAAGRVVGVVQTGPHPAVPVANATTISLDRDAVEAAAGSRYAPSAPLAELEPVLASGRPHAFVGKPCDVAALRALARHDPRVDAAIPYKLSFFCAGIPSQTGAEEVLQALGTSLPDTAAFRFRGRGWPGMATATAHDGTERQMTYHASWGGVLSRHVQHRCKICPDGTGVDADLVCADAWESDADGYPVFDERDGISLVVARTETGRALMQAAEAAGAIVTAPFEVARLAAIQPGQRERRRALLARLWGCRATGRPVPAYRGLGLVAAARQNSVGRNLKNFVGMVRRSLRRAGRDRGRAAGKT